MDDTLAAATGSDLAAILAGAIAAAEAWRRQAGRDSEEAARRDRLVWQLQHIAKKMLTPPQTEDQPR